MIMLLLAPAGAVFPRSFLPIPLHPPVPELLLVERSSHHASAASWIERVESGERVGLDFPSPRSP